MDWKLFSITFIAIFLAELGDKTQLATMGMAANNAAAKWTIFSASALALVLSSFIGVIAGSYLSKFLSPMTLKTTAAILFILIGIYLTFDAYGEVKLRKFEVITNFLLELEESKCHKCEKMQGTVAQIPHEETREKFIVPTEHPELRCNNCNADRLRNILSRKIVLKPVEPDKNNQPDKV